jgi:hypothetical protein
MKIVQFVLKYLLWLQTEIRGDFIKCSLLINRRHETFSSLIILATRKAAESSL